MLKIFRSCPSRLKSCAYLFTQEQPWGHCPDRMHTCAYGTCKKHKTSHFEHMLFLISSGLPLICPLMLKLLSIVEGVSYRSSMITQMVSVLRWWKRFHFLSKGNFLIKGGDFHCSDMFFKLLVSECSRSRCCCSCLDVSWLFCSLAAAVLPPQTVCAPQSALWSPRPEVINWHETVKSYFPTGSDVVSLCLQHDSSVRHATILFPALLFAVQPRHGFSVATHPSIILFLHTSEAHIIVVWMFSSKHCPGDDWDGP